VYAQLPAAQVEAALAAAQAPPQRPQWAALVRVSTSQPLVGTPSQSAKPALQAPTRQAPAAQAAVALGSAQVRPHAPQLATVVARLVSQPLATAPSQLS
jgi:hypothetical protein